MKAGGGGHVLSRRGMRLGPRGRAAPASVGPVVPAGHTLLFVGGLHRSGTTPLTRYLSSHPAMSAFSGTGVPEDEGQHLQDVYRTASAHGGPGRFAFARRAHLTESEALVNDRNRARLLGSWIPHWDSEKPIWVEKSPPNIIRTRFLNALFPHSAFVMVVRHPVEVALATRKWSRQRLDVLIEHWLVAHRILLEDAERLEQIVVVSYERLVEDAAGALAPLYAQLGVDPHPSDAGFRRSYATRYRAEWLSFPEADQLDLFRRFEAGVNEFGYSLGPDWGSGPELSITR